MEISPEDAVPYLDRVPHGVVQLITRLGGTVVPSGPLVTTFAARWSPAELADHLAAAEVLASVARTALAQAVTEGGTGLRETVLQARVVAGAGGSGAGARYPPHRGVRAQRRQSPLRA